MKQQFIFLIIIFTCYFTHAQETVYPARAQQQAVTITNAVIHVGNGKVIDNGTITFNKGKITYVGTALAEDKSATVVDAKGKHVYPGLILPATDLGLKEVANGLRGGNDFREIEENNASVRSIVAYNTDSRVINTLRSNGILLAHVVPQGGLIGGLSSVVQLDAWNWEDAAYKTDLGVHLYMPVLLNRPARGRRAGSEAEKDVVDESMQRIDKIKAFFADAKAHAGNPAAKTNLKLSAVKGLFDKTQRLFVHTNNVKEMLIAIDFVKEFGMNVTIVGGNDSWMIAPLLKEHNISVILNQPHSLPVMQDDDIDQPFKTPALLQKAGVLFAINDSHNESRYRNLMFNAGTAAAYGLNKEEALMAITLNAARILSIDSITGSLETGKDANIIISEGDILNIPTSKITEAFIQGRKIDLTDKHKLLHERYRQKYEGEGKAK